MKTLKIKLLLLAIPIVMMACNSQTNRTKDNKTDDYATTNDSINKNAAVVGDDNMNQNQDQDFIIEAVSGSLMEIELGRYAQQNAMNPRVRNFASMMVRDHSQVNEELKSIASRKNITFPTAMEDNHREMMSDIQKKTGADFDREYMKGMVDDHQKDVDKFKKYAERDNVDADLKSFAAKTLPILLMHQDSAKNINDAIDRNTNISER